jgi:hypothetical protein
LPINSQSSDSTAHEINEVASHGAEQSVAMLRGAPVEVNTQRVVQFVVVLVALTLAVLSVTFFVSGVHRNSNITNLQHHGVSVSVTVLSCTGELGGSGSNVADFICEGTFTLNGKRYNDTIPGQSFLASGTKATFITAKNSPGLLATSSEVKSESSSWTVFILPLALFAALVALVILVARHRSRRSTSSSRSETVLPIQQSQGEPSIRVGFAGLGTMGAFMAANLIRAGFDVTVWNRTPGRAANLVDVGAREAASPRRTWAIK